MIFPTTKFVRVAALSLLFAEGSALAQNVQAPSLVPGLENFQLPGPAAPTPTPTPTPTRVPTPTPTAVPPPRAAPVRRAPTPVPTPAPATTRDVQAALPAPTPLPTAAPQEDIPLPAATPTVPVAAMRSDSDADAPGSRMPAVIALAALAAIALAGLGLFVRRRRRSAERDHEKIPDEAEATAAETLPEAPPAAVPPPMPAAPETPRPLASPAPSFLYPAAPQGTQRARIELDLRPVRAGTNLTSAALDYEVTIRNAGTVAAADIRVDLGLISAAADQDAVLNAFFTSLIARPLVAPFALAPGQQVSLSGMAMSPRETLNVVTVQGRALFVPLFVCNILYDWDGGPGGQSANAWMIGIEQADGGKMQPFRLDAGPRMFDRVGQRLHALAIAR